MPQYKIQNLFPTPLMMHDDITTTEKQRDFVYAQEWYRPEANNGWLTENHYLLDEPVMKTLKDQIMSAFNKMVGDVLQLPDTTGWRMTNSWGVKHNTGDWAQEHIHTNCVFSGVYYMDVNDSAGFISFLKSVNDNSTLPLVFRPGVYKEPTDYNLDHANVHPYNGLLVCFPSSLMHKVSVNESEWDRYSLAFNFFPTGTWGREEHELIL